MTYSLILASGSPRRRELLKTCGIPISKVAPPDIIESRNKQEDVLQYVQRLAREKSLAVRHQGAWVIAADTIVTMGDQVFEKPVDDENAAQMLERLSGQWHTVVTAWAISEHSIDPNQKPLISESGYSISEVLFRELSENEIRSYVKIGEGRDKAGAYGIQGLGAALVKSIRGDYSNIVGLPMSDVLDALNGLGILPTDQP